MGETDKKPLLVIEVDDMSAIPTVYYQGEKIEGRIAIQYQWETRGIESFGEHKVVIEHAMSDDKMTIRRLEFRRFV